MQPALADYAKAIALDSGNLDARLAQAGLLLDVGRLDDADRAVADLEKISPREPRAAYLRAVVASQRNDPDTVRKALTDAVALIDPAPKKVVSRYGQLLLVGGLAHYGLGNMEKAGEYLRAVCEAESETARTEQIAGKSSTSIDAIRHARSNCWSHCTHCDERSADDVAAGRGLHGRPKIRLATPLLERAVRVAGGAPDVRADFGVSLLGDGQSELGFSQLQQAFAKDPGQAHAGVVLATLYLKRGQSKKALEVIDAVVRRDPKNVNAVNLQGVVRVAAETGPGAARRTRRRSRSIPAITRRASISRGSILLKANRTPPVCA